jgi:hypothetical protein
MDAAKALISFRNKDNHPIVNNIKIYIILISERILAVNMRGTRISPQHAPNDEYIKLPND